jgi:hypothetical protein
MRIDVIASRIGPASAGPFFYAKGVFMVFAGLLGLALAAVLIWWGRPINGVISPRVQSFELLYATTICLVFAGALAMLVAG